VGDRVEDFDVTGNDVTRSRESETGNEREIISRAFPPYPRISRVYGFTMIDRILFFVFVNIFDDAIRVLSTFFMFI
jgi:hypothetical protein